MWTGPNDLAWTAGVPVTCTIGRLPLVPAGTMAYQWPITMGSTNVLADVAATTGRVVVPSITMAPPTGQGLRTSIDVVDPASIIAKTTWPLRTWTSIFEWPWM